MQSFLSVADVLHRPAFRDAQLMAGNRGAQRAVRWVHILDVPEAVELIRGGELVLTTGMGFGTASVHFRTFLEQLIDGQAAGLCIELGTAVQEVPAEVRALADASAFPLIVFPTRVRFVDITQDLHKLILTQERRAFYEQDWVEQQVRGSLHGVEPIVGGAHLNADKHLRVAVLSIADALTDFGQTGAVPGTAPQSNDALSDPANDWFNRRSDLSMHVRTAFARHGARALVSVRADTVVCIVELDPTHAGGSGDRSKCVASVYETLQHTLHRIGWPMEGVCIGVGNEVSTLAMVPQSYENATTTHNVCKQMKQHGWLLYEDTGIYRWVSLLSEHPQSATYSLHDLQSLLDYDQKHHTELFITLKAYLDCDRSKQQTAAVLFIHRQTLYHRLEQISRILPVDLDNPVHRLSLHLSVYYHYFRR